MDLSMMINKEIQASPWKLEQQKPAELANVIADRK